jgi:hypothetical protein
MQSVLATARACLAAVQYMHLFPVPAKQGHHLTNDWDCSKKLNQIFDLSNLRPLSGALSKHLILFPNVGGVSLLLSALHHGLSGCG